MHHHDTQMFNDVQWCSLGQPFAVCRVCSCAALKMPWYLDAPQAWWHKVPKWSAFPALVLPSWQRRGLAKFDGKAEMCSAQTWIESWPVLTQFLWPCQAFLSEAEIVCGRPIWRCGAAANRKLNELQSLQFAVSRVEIWRFQTGALTHILFGCHGLAHSQFRFESLIHRACVTWVPLCGPYWGYLCYWHHWHSGWWDRQRRHQWSCCQGSQKGQRQAVCAGLSLKGQLCKAMRRQLEDVGRRQEVCSSDSSGFCTAITGYNSTI